LVLRVLEEPQQVVEEDERKVAQSEYADPRTGRQHLLRVVYEERADDKLMITAYETSKIRKYWRA